MLKILGTSFSSGKICLHISFHMLVLDRFVALSSFIRVSYSSDSEDEEDDTVYVEDDISDGDIQEGDND